MGTGVSASYGFTGTITEAQWAVVQRPTNRGYVEGCAPSVGGGTREAVIASGTVWVAGSYHTVSGATLTLAENTSGQARIDYVCLYVNYSTDDAALVVVQGTPSASPAPPTGSLTQTAGVGWHVPLAEVTVASGAGVLSASAVNDVRPGPWIDVTPLSPWANYGGAEEVLSMRMDPMGDVHLRGMVRTTSTVSSPSLPRFFWLPALWRPTARESFAVYAKDGSASVEVARVQVSPDGQVLALRPQTTTGERYYHLSGIRFTPNS